MTNTPDENPTTIEVDDDYEDDDIDVVDPGENPYARVESVEQDTPVMRP